MTSQPPLISGAESASKLHIMSTEATLHCYSDSTVLNSSAKEMHTSDQRVIESDLSNHDLTRSDWLSPLQNPINWSPMRKWTTVFLLVITNFIAATYTSAFEPALPAIMVNFHSANDSVASLTVSIYTIGYCLGPFIIASMSELYGRATVLYPGYIGFMLALAVCGSSRNLLLSVIFRAIMGFAAITFVLMCPAIVADLIPREERGLALSIMSAGPVVGPTIGPIVGGYIVENTSWRWIFYSTLIAFGLLFSLSLVILKGTYGPVVSRRKQRKEEEYLSQSQPTPEDTLKQLGLGPLKCFSSSP